jgi:hypothetical protein
MFWERAAFAKEPISMIRTNKRKAAGRSARIQVLARTEKTLRLLLSRRLPVEPLWHVGKLPNYLFERIVPVTVTRAFGEYCFRLERFASWIQVILIKQNGNFESILVTGYHGPSSINREYGTRPDGPTGGTDAERGWYCNNDGMVKL